MPIFRGFRRLLEALELIALALGELVEGQKDAGRVVDRIDALELSRLKFEAECEGRLLKADGKLKAAANSEARERQLKGSYERLAFERGEELPEGTEPGDTVLPVDAQAGEEERLRALRLVVASDPKAQALRHKFGT